MKELQHEHTNRQFTDPARATQIPLETQVPQPVNKFGFLCNIPSQLRVCNGILQ